jgi:Putative restriction endonuclease
MASVNLDRPKTGMQPVVLPHDIPILYEDDGREGMGEAAIHPATIDILFLGIDTHVKQTRPGARTFSNLNTYYPAQPPPEKLGVLPYVSPDIMVVHPSRPLPENIRSYTIGRDGPAPLQTTEVLSESSADLRDLDKKPQIYAGLGVAEYILVDATGEYLPQRLLLKRLQPDGTWRDEQDSDGGITSRLGFRIIFDSDGKLRVVNAKTGEKYPRPEEAWLEQRARQRAEAGRADAERRVRELEAEIERLRKKPGQ